MDGGAVAAGLKIQDRNRKIVWISFKISQETQSTDLLTAQCAVFVSNRDERRQQLLSWDKFALLLFWKLVMGQKTYLGVIVNIWILEGGMPLSGSLSLSWGT